MPIEEYYPKNLDSNLSEIDFSTLNLRLIKAVREKLSPSQLERCFNSACLNNSLDIVRYLFPFINKRNMGLNLAIQENCWEIIDYLLTGNDRDLLRNKVDPNGVGEIPLSLACWDGRLKIVKLLIQAGVPLRFEGFSGILRRAGSSGNLELVKYLMTFSPDIDVVNSALVDTIRTNQWEILGYLIDRGASKEKALNVACQLGALECAECLIDKEANINNRSLAVAIEADRYEIVQLLVSYNVRVSSDIIGLAELMGNEKIIQLLRSQYHPISMYESFIDYLT